MPLRESQLSRSGPLVIYFLAYTSGYTPPFSRMSFVARLASLLLCGYNPWLSVSFSAYDSFPSLSWQRLLNGHQYLFSPLYGTWFNVFSSIPYRYPHISHSCSLLVSLFWMSWEPFIEDVKTTLSLCGEETTP